MRRCLLITGLCLVALTGRAASSPASQPTLTGPTSQPSGRAQERSEDLQELRSRRAWRALMRRLVRRYATARSQAERDEVLDEIYALDDPDALSAAVLLLDSDYIEIRRAAVTIVSMRDVDSDDLPDRLVDIVLGDPSDDIRHIAAGALSRVDSPVVLTRLLRALRRSDPHSSRWAAIALGELGSYRAVPFLISQLWVRIQVPSGTLIDSQSESYIEGVDVLIAPGTVAYQPRILKRGGSSSVSGGSKTVYVHNPDAREALIKITGQDFAFDQSAWNAWWRRYRAELLERDEARQPASRLSSEGPLP